MIWLLIAILAQIILGTSAVFDKLLLKHTRLEPVMYTFLLGLIGGLVFLLIPFGGLSIGIWTLLIALLAGAIFILALFALFSALHKGKASAVLPLIAAFLPIFTYGFSMFFLHTKLTGMDIIGFSFLILGGFLFFIAEEKGIRHKVLILAAISAILFAVSNVSTKLVFEHSSFIAGFTWIKIGGVIAALAFLIAPAIRKKIFAAHNETATKHKGLYFVNRLYAGIGSILVYVAISLAHPALVDATQVLRYMIIFVAAWLLLHEHSNRRDFLIKIAATGIIIVGFIWLSVVAYARSIPVDINRPIAWGVTFSSKFSKELGLDWRNNFDSILYEVRPHRVRLVAYWDEIEKVKGKFDFNDLDWEMARAAEAQIPVVLAIGMRVPRWPECHIPQWAINLPVEEREEMLRGYLGELIRRYQDSGVLDTWQLENEPFLRFGLCPQRGKDFFEKELELVRRLDLFRQILVTDSGEFGTWHKAVKSGDIFGTTMYRKVYPPSIGWLVGIVEYPISPSFFRFREKVARFLTGEHDKKFIVVELQSEPWGSVEIPLLSYEEQVSIFPPEYFRETIEYAKRAGFDEYYLWGAEWWYFVKEKHGDSRYWNMAKSIF